MAKNRYKNGGDNRDGGTFVALPHTVLESPALTALSPHGHKLLIDLMAQYRGNNNGDLCAAWKLMQPRGWRSEATLNKAKKELIRVGLIVETRKGARPNKATLYALTWFALDYCNGKLDIAEKGFNRRAYLLYKPTPDGALPTTPAVAVDP